MNKKTFFIFIFMFIISCTSTPVSLKINNEQQRILQDEGNFKELNEKYSNNPDKEILIKFKEGITFNREINDSPLGGFIVPISSETGWYKLRLKDDVDKNKAIEFYNSLSSVECVQENTSLHIPETSLKIESNNQPFVPNDPAFKSQQWYIPMVGIDKAWGITLGSRNITVAVIDSGVDPNHPDLKDNLLPLIDVWSEMRTNDIFSYITFSRTTTSSITGSNYIPSKVIITKDYTGIDGQGHGTHITGILGAVINNNIGISGVAGNIKILPIKATNYDGDTQADVLTRAIQKAIDNNVNLINISIGGPASEGSEALRSVVNEAIKKGITIVSPTGNESRRIYGNIVDVTVPAAYPGVISVAACTEYKKVANYSNGGPETLITAPGGGDTRIPDKEGRGIYSTWPTYKTSADYKLGREQRLYNSQSGTSMASPMVSGVVALMLSEEPYLTPSQIRERLIVTARDIWTPGFDNDTGYGLLDAYAALTWKYHDGFK